MMTNGKAALAYFFGILVAAALTSEARAGDVPQVEVVRVPDGGSYPQAQTDGRGRIHLLYAKGDPARAAVYYVRSDDGGRTFTRPIPVNSVPRSAIIVGTVRGPHLALGRGDRVHVAWMGSDEARPRAVGKATPMLYTRLNDAGDAFEPQRNVISKHPGLDGGGSVAADGGGNVYVAWHAPDGAEGEANRTVWLSRSRDDGKTFEEETAILPEKTGVCGCCGMRAYAGTGGKVFIVYRTATRQVHRDIHMLQSDDYGQSFRVAASDPWNVGTCVMSTAAIAQTSDGVLGAWETTDQVRLATLAPGSNDVKLLTVPGAAKASKHPAVASNRLGQSVVAWAVGTGWNKGGSAAWQVFDDRGRPMSVQSGRREGLPVWSVPAAVALPDGSFRVIF